LQIKFRNSTTPVQKQASNFLSPLLLNIIGKKSTAREVYVKGRASLYLTQIKNGPQVPTVSLIKQGHAVIWSCIRAPLRRHSSGPFQERVSAIKK